MGTNKNCYVIRVKYILTFDAAFSTKTGEPGNWGLKLLLRDTLQHALSFVNGFVYLAGRYHCMNIQSQTEILLL